MPYKIRPNDKTRAYRKTEVFRANRRKGVKKHDTNNPDQRHGRKMKSMYGIDHDEYWNLAASQSNLCAICNKAERHSVKGRTKNLCVDHNHSTNKVRGLLCNSCNAIIGFAREDILILEAAIAYLRKHNRNN